MGREARKESDIFFFSLNLCLASVCNPMPERSVKPPKSCYFTLNLFYRMSFVFLVSIVGLCSPYIDICESMGTGRNRMCLQAPNGLVYVRTATATLAKGRTLEHQFKDVSRGFWERWDQAGKPKGPGGQPAPNLALI